MFVRGNLRFAIAVTAALAFCAASHARVWYVDKSNDSGTEDGTSWATAYSTIQPAIDAAHEDGGGEVWIAAGVYDERRYYDPAPEGASWTRNDGSLLLREHVRLLGGFGGFEASRVERKVTRNRAVIDGATARDGESAYNVVVGASHTTIDGLTITGGWHGMNNANLEFIRIVNCVFTENGSGSCVGVRNHRVVDGVIDRCVFSNNFGFKTAVVFNQYSSVVITDSTFIDNRGGLDSLDRPSSWGVVVNNASSVRILRCSFQNNLDASPLSYRLRSLVGVRSLEVIECDFVGNESVFVMAAALVVQDFVLERTTFMWNRSSRIVSLFGLSNTGEVAGELRDASIVNCAFVNNSEGDQIELLHINLDLRGCTFTGNLFGSETGNIFDIHRLDDPDRPTRIHATNSIFWNGGNSYEFIPEVEESGILVIENSIVRGGYAGEGIIAERPSFRDRPDGDFRLLPHSVGVDIADVATALGLDLFGAPRPQGPGPDMGAHEVRVVNPTLCEAAPEIEAALGRLRFVAELYGDLDEDGLPEIASLRLLSAAACAYDTSKGFAAERAFELNLDAIDDEPFDMRILRKRELIAALMAVGEQTQRTVRDAFAEEGVVLLGSYAVVACDETGICETVFIDAATRGAVPVTMDEPFPGPGDYALDGLTNSEEWAGVMSQGGGLDEFIRAATDPTIRATVASASSGGCFIATAAYGTPLAGEIDVLRTLRDRRLLPNPLGAAFTDTYYRLSPPLADTIAGNPTLRAATRFSIGVVLSSIEILRTLHGWILMLGLALTVAAAIRRGARAT
ncbi:MAG: right-handed parallel beta-helix repeat-containing protein [Candidatus Hydrogenedentes bacterium]|nr:right-handed parallel beta-helix repeat-containing protein [Candidatus Hydrogenedentota bacterium]